MKNAEVSLVVCFTVACPHCKLYVQNIVGGTVVRYNNVEISGTCECVRCHKKFAVPVLKMEALADSMRELRVAGD